MRYHNLKALVVILASSAASTAVIADEKIEYGQYLSSSCVTCHQLSGKDNGIPAIVGWDKESFVEVLKSYKTKERDNKAMQVIVATMSKDEMEALAAYFGSLKAKE